MTSSRSSSLRSSWLTAIAVLAMLTGIAQAGRKRVVVLDFEGPKAEKFHDDVVKLIKKTDTVVATDKWNGAAEELSATKVNGKNVRKIAKKLKVDGVVMGKVEKTDDGYVVTLKLRAGSSGEYVGDKLDTTNATAKLDKKARKLVTDSLVTAIEALEAPGAGDDAPEVAVATEPKAEDDTKHGAFGKKKDLDTQTGADATDDAPKKHKHDKDADVEVKADDNPPKKADLTVSDEPTPHHKHKKDVAASDGDADASATVSVEEPARTLTHAESLLPNNRAVDFQIGMSFTARHLQFKYEDSLGNQPPSYKEGVPVAGGIMDFIVYPAAITHVDHGILNNLGIEVMYDKVIAISTKKNYVDTTSGDTMTASLGTVEDHFAIGAVFRYPLGNLTLGAKLMYMSQQFNIVQTLPSGAATDVPDVHYGAAEPKIFFHYLAGKLVFNGDFGYMLVTKTGDISTDGTTGYGGSKDSGYEATISVDYSLTKAIFARVQAHYEEMSLTFKGDPNSLSNTRDGDMTTQDVTGAKDYYYGGAVSIGYAY